jgi:hypothetical protein
MVAARPCFSRSVRRSVTVRQVYALAAALCARAGEPWPETFDEASELIGRVRTEIEHPQPRLEDCPPRRRRRRLDRRLHDELVDELVGPRVLAVRREAARFGPA